MSAICDRDMGGVSTEALDREVDEICQWLQRLADEKRLDGAPDAELFVLRAQSLSEHVRRSDATIKAGWATIRCLERGQIAFCGKLIDGVWVRDGKPYGTFDEAVAI